MNKKKMVKFTISEKDSIGADAEGESGETVTSTFSRKRTSSI